MAFRNDDISANTNLAHEQSVLDVFWKYRVKQTFAIIPDSHGRQLGDNREIVEALKRWREDGIIEFALHGYTHKRGNNAAGEFGSNVSYKEQFDKIKTGKTLLDTVLMANVDIFAPPWNQADENTIRACVNAGMHVFSGYMGADPNRNIRFVNTNAVLFSKGNPIGEGRGLPHIETVLKAARNAKGPTFIIVFYHSRSDFRSPTAYSYLDNLLSDLKNDPTIDISSTGDIAKKYTNLLPVVNQAGMNIKEAKRASYRAKLLLVIRQLSNFIGVETWLDETFDKAFVAYWSGDYKYASKLAIEIIGRCDNYIGFLRIMSALNSGALLLIFLSVMKYRKLECSFRHYRYFVAVCSLPVIAIGVYLNVFRPVSAQSVTEFNIVGALFVGGLVALSSLLYLVKVLQTRLLAR